MNTVAVVERIEAVLNEARQCVALTNIVREQLGGPAVSHRESELIRLSSVLANRIYSFFWEDTVLTMHASSMACGTSGKLKATLEVIVDICDRVPLVVCDAEVDKLVTRLGWMQNAADDLAEELVDVIEGIRAEVEAA